MLVVVRVRVRRAGGEYGNAQERDQQEERGGASRERGAARARDPSGGGHLGHRSRRNARRPRGGGGGAKRRVRLETLARDAPKKRGVRVRGAGERAEVLVGRGGGGARVTM